MISRFTCVTLRSLLSRKLNSGKVEIRLLKARMVFPFLQVEGLKEDSLGYPGYREVKRKGRDSVPFPFPMNTGPSLSRPWKRTFSPETWLTRMYHETQAVNSSRLFLDEKLS